MPDNPSPVAPRLAYASAVDLLALPEPDAGDVDPVLSAERGRRLADFRVVRAQLRAAAARLGTPFERDEDMDTVNDIAHDLKSHLFFFSLPRDEQMLVAHRLSIRRAQPLPLTSDLASA